MDKKISDLREKFSWAMYDFANSGYATVVLTTVFNTWFVSGIVTGDAFDSGSATLLWTIAIAIGNFIILFSAPVLGAIADIYAVRKRLLIISSAGCIIFTALLALPQPGDIWLAMGLLIASYVMFASGENLIAAFLPELTTTDNIGRLSGYGWALGFIGGLLTLLLCLLYINAAEAAGQSAADFIPHTMLIVSGCFLVSALPTLFWLKERNKAQQKPAHQIIKNTFRELKTTLLNLKHYPDLKVFMISLTCFHAGIYIVIVLAAVYAQQVMGFDTKENIILIAVVNITAAIGAFGFGHLQDKLGSVRTLILTLLIWCLAILLAWSSKNLLIFWIAANLIGIALGASQSASRALMGLFSPSGHYGEYFGLWGLCVKLAAIIGPISYGILNKLTAGDHRTSLLITLLYFIAGLLLLLRVNELRGRQRAGHII
ncbi:MAG: MFS transporter [Gammaproteobacteria bacterium]|nr:MFS transporter [Gammaproteobacteria bacterium]